MAGSFKMCMGSDGKKCHQGYLINLITSEPERPCPICNPLQDAAGNNIPTLQLHTNVMGHVHSPTTAKHEELVKRIRDIGLEFYALLHEAGGTDPNQERFANRRLAMAASDLETAVMYAVKGVCERS